MNIKFLNIVLQEDISFKELILKMEKLFNTSLPYQNMDGRLIAKGRIDEYDVSIIDRHDGLDEKLCDDNHNLRISLILSDSPDYEKIENRIKERLNNRIKWKEGIWAPVKEDEAYRRVYPQKETELFFW